jgi:hypothetical protein
VRELREGLLSDIPILACVVAGRQKQGRYRSGTPDTDQRGTSFMTERNIRNVVAATTTIFIHNAARGG